MAEIREGKKQTADIITIKNGQQIMYNAHFSLIKRKVKLWIFVYVLRNKWAPLSQQYDALQTDMEKIWRK